MNRTRIRTKTPTPRLSREGPTAVWSRSRNVGAETTFTFMTPFWTLGGSSAWLTSLATLVHRSMIPSLPPDFFAWKYRAFLRMLLL